MELKYRVGDLVLITRPDVGGPSTDEEISVIVGINENDEEMPYRVYNKTYGYESIREQSITPLIEKKSKEADGTISFDEEPEQEDPSDDFKKITDSMHDTFVKKNHDYGNSFEQSCDEEGIVAARVRMRDKWNRFVTLSSGSENKVADESIRDTLLDLANYAILTIMWMDKNNK